MSDERLCVATFGEEIGWVTKAGIEACVYDAIGTRAGLIPVPNEAREASQYLRHIVDHYGDFREYEIFLQGDPHAHHPSFETLLRNRPWRGQRCFPISRRVLPFAEGVAAHREAALVLAGDSGLTVGEDAVWVAGAMFAASREALMSYPLGWWERLLGRVIVEREISPWAMERLWLEILSPDHQR